MASTSGHRNELRVAEGRETLDRLARAFDAWRQQRARADRHGQYHRQLDDLGAAVHLVLDRLRAEFDALDTTLELGPLYERCRNLDRSVLALQRIWQFFREKWDQRDDPQLGPVLRAADEIVWSCWAGPHRVLGKQVEAAPLPYIDPELSAHAWPRRRPPAQARSADARLQELVALMPIPLIGLPPICTTRPWWLVVLAHEIGHHVASDLLPVPVIQRLSSAVEAQAHLHVGVERRDPRWAVWAEELFADAFAVVNTGSAHPWALAELELGDEQWMATPRRAYPSPRLRLAVNEALLVLVSDADAVAASAPQEPDGAAVVPVARALMDTPLDEQGTDLRQLCGYSAHDFAPDGAVAGWTEQLLAAREQLACGDTLEAARHAVAGAVDAWQRVASTDPGERPDQQERLRIRTLALVSGSRAPGTRAAAADRPQRTREAVAQRLADELLSNSGEDD